MANSKGRVIWMFSILILLTVVFPLGSWYYLNSGYNYFKNSYQELKDYGQIPAFELTNQYGEKITETDLDKQVVIADFIFTRCGSICPKMTVQMQRLYEVFKENPNVTFLSYSVDPEHDDVAVLKQYADAYGVEEGTAWYFLTGDKKTIHQLGRKGYKLPTDDGMAGDGEDFLHSNQFVLADTSGMIRNYYDGTDPKAVERLVEHLSFIVPKPAKADFEFKPEKEK